MRFSLSLLRFDDGGALAYEQRHDGADFSIAVQAAPLLYLTPEQLLEIASGEYQTVLVQDEGESVLICTVVGCGIGLRFAFEDYLKLLQEIAGWGCEVAMARTAAAAGLKPHLRPQRTLNHLATV